MVSRVFSLARSSSWKSAALIDILKIRYIRNIIRCFGLFPFFVGPVTFMRIFEVSFGSVGVGILILFVCGLSSVSRMWVFIYVLKARGAFIV